MAGFFGVQINGGRMQFFDTPKVMRAVDKATRKNLSKFGAFVRRRAKSSIRKRRRTADAGSPPSSHVGTLRKLIFFGYDHTSRSVVIGPTLFRPGSIVPRLLEEGGRGSLVRRDGSLTRRRYRKFPYMKPAFDEEIRRLPTFWKDSITR